ncbi:MAG: adenylyltransferase/cytidyltransferase family protein [Crocinitomicaceae bacterium]
MKNLTTLNHKILLDYNEAEIVCHSKQLEGKTIVFTNGCFDILHKGHVEYLAQAADLGDVLIIAVNTDASVKMQNKGKERPINKESDRLALLAALFFVDYVLLFNEDTPLELIKKLKPNVLAKGADYNPDETDTKSKKYIVGREDVLKNNGKVKVIDLVSGFSTTNIVNKLKS